MMQVALEILQRLHPAADLGRNLLMMRHDLVERIGRKRIARHQV